MADAYLVTFLDVSDQLICLDKVMSIAEDPREAAPNRGDALGAACNLVLGQKPDVKAAVHLRSKRFATGGRDGSALDDQTTRPHPLSSWKVDLGTVSLAPAGLRLAEYSAVTDADKEWVRERAIAMLATNEPHVIHQAAVTLSRLERTTPAGLDASLLAGHPASVVRQLAVVIAASDLHRWSNVLEVLAQDSDPAVRRLLANRLREEGNQAQPADLAQGSSAMHEALTVLGRDVRRSVRMAADGQASWREQHRS